MVLALFVLVPLFIERVDQWSGWKSGEWAAAGAWLGGVMTFGAVSVAVWQTNNANQQARRAEKRADVEVAASEKRSELARIAASDRHAAEITAANDRVRRQIESARRTEQVQATALLWSAIGNVHEQVWNVDDAFFRVEKDEGTVEDLNRAYALYVTSLTRIETAFTTVYFLIREKTIEDLIKKTEDEHKLLVKAMQKAYRDHENTNYHDQTHLRNSMKAVDALRDPMIKVARDYLDSVESR